MTVFELVAAGGLCIAIVSLAMHLTSDSFREVCRRLRQNEAEIADLSDRTSLWMKRDSVRQARERKAEKQEVAELVGISPELARLQKKAQIRARAKSGRLQ